MPDFRRILVVKLSAMGDVVHALPVVPYLRRAVPSAEIHWAVDARFAGLLEGNPGIAKVVPLPIKEWKGRAGSPATWREAVAAAGALRRERYDVAFDVQGNIKSGVVTWMSGAPLRYGYPREVARERQNLWFTNRRPEASPEDRHVTRKILRVASAPFGGGFPGDDLKGEIANTPEEIAAAGRLLFDALPGAAPRLAVHPGTTWNTKRMDTAFWAETVRLLRGSFPSLGAFLSWGTDREREECLAIRDLAGGRVELLPRLGYKALAAVYRVCGHMIGPDTGPLHLAAVAGAKTVSVFRGSDGKYAAPVGAGHRFLQAPLPCTACQIKGDKVCPRDAECRASIRSSEVAAAMAGLMRFPDPG
ncbi:MAG: lipopolysaccharide heptosyltransferase family protein [Deltaproteobacteria bacterium]|nr:MAG: lipopolysaccharide heptosyltransferase family protein [Deltaproteobacteria bacterium]